MRGVSLCSVFLSANMIDWNSIYTYKDLENLIRNEFHHWHVATAVSMSFISITPLELLS
jgi:hypothetical protein